MKSYSEEEVFAPWEIQAFTRAVELVDSVPPSTGLRCHELARAVMMRLVEEWSSSPERSDPGVLSHGFEIQVIDGYYGMVEHSFIYLGRVAAGGFGAPPNVLDVYTPGRMPQVQLVSSSSTLPFYYRRGTPRDDIKIGIVESLLTFWKARFG